MVAEISLAGDDSFEKFPRELIGGSDKKWILYGEQNIHYIFRTRH